MDRDTVSDCPTAQQGYVQKWRDAFLDHDFVWWRLRAIALLEEPSAVPEEEINQSIGSDRYCYHVVRNAGQRVRSQIDPPKL